jgi:hypothetical protein
MASERTGLQRLAGAHDGHAAEGGTAAPEAVRGGMGEEDVADPGAEIVDGRDQAAAVGGGRAEGGFEARMDKDGG